MFVFMSNFKDCLPIYQIMDMEQHLNTISELEQQLNLVIKGQSTMARESLNGDDVNTKIGQAKTAASAFQVSLQGAEAVVMKKRSAEQTEDERKEKKAKKDKKT